MSGGRYANTCFSISSTCRRNALSVSSRFDTALHEWSTVAWLRPPMAAPIVASGALVLFCHQYGIQTMVIAYTVFIIAWLLVWQWMMKRVAGLRFLDVAKDILPFMLCAAATMVVTYFMTRSLQNIYLLLLVRLLVSATIYFCIMKLLKVQILEECIAFCKRGR